MSRKLFIIILCMVFSFMFFSFFSFCKYMQRQYQNKKMVSYCYTNNSKECYTRMFELLLPKILLYNANINNFKLKLYKLDPESRIDSFDALSQSDKLIGYGVYYNTLYEEAYSRAFDRISYTFDCGVDDSYTTKDNRCLFSSECIASDDFLILDQISSGKVHTLEQKLKELDLLDKKVFLKVDVAEADTIVLPEIIKNAYNITGFNIALHLRTSTSIIDKISLLDEINKKFVLISRNTRYFDNNNHSEFIDSKYFDGILNDRGLYLSYINKDLLDSYSISFCQNTDKYYKNTILLEHQTSIPMNDVSIFVTLTEIVKKYFKKIEK